MATTIGCTSAAVVAPVTRLADTLASDVITDRVVTTAAHSLTAWAKRPCRTICNSNTVKYFLMIQELKMSVSPLTFTTSGTSEARWTCTLPCHVITRFSHSTHTFLPTVLAIEPWQACWNCNILLALQRAAIQRSVLQKKICSQITREFIFLRDNENMVAVVLYCLLWLLISTRLSLHLLPFVRSSHYCSHVTHL